MKQSPHVGIGAPTRRDRREFACSVCSSLWEDAVRRQSSSNHLQTRYLICWYPGLGLVSLSELWQIHLCCSRHPLYGILLQPPELTKISLLARASIRLCAALLLGKQPPTCPPATPTNTNNKMTTKMIETQ